MVSYEYFMDEMQEYEIDILVENLPYCEQAEWLRTRYIVWSNLKPYLKKKSMSPSELFPLPFDDDENSIKTDIKLSEIEIENYRKMLENMNGQM